MRTGYENIIIGGGVMGAATAYALSKRGQQVLLLEQFAPTHAQGSSHGDGRIMRFNYTEAIYLQMAQLAYPAWDALGAAAGQPLYQLTGIIEYGPQASPEVQTSAAQLQAFGVPCEVLPGDEAQRRFPQFRFASDHLVLYQADGAILRADTVVQQLWTLAAAQGAQLRTQVQVSAIEPAEQGVTLHSSTGECWQAARVIVCAGAWTGRLLAATGLELPLTVTQEEVAFYPSRPGSSHRVGEIPVLLDYTVSPPFYSLPQMDVPGLKAGWHHTGPAIDPSAPLPLDEKRLAALTDWIRRRYPYLQPEPFGMMRCLYTNTPDYHFILDRHPQFPRLTLAAGFSGHGFKFAPVIGELLADLALESAPALPLDSFSLARFENRVQLQKRLGA